MPKKIVIKKYIQLHFISQSWVSFKTTDKEIAEALEAFRNKEMFSYKDNEGTNYVDMNKVETLLVKEVEGFE